MKIAAGTMKVEGKKQAYVGIKIKTRRKSTRIKT